MKVKVSQSCLTLCNPLDYTVDGILKARILEWVAYPFSRGSSGPGNQTSACCIAGGFFTNWTDWESHPILVRHCYPAWNLNIELNLISAGQEATIRTGHGTTDWFQIGKGVCQGCILSPCLFNFYAEYIMRNSELEEAQAGIKIARRNINNLRYADDTTLMAENRVTKNRTWLSDWTESQYWKWFKKSFREKYK